jgi:transcriptional regulator
MYIPASHAEQDQDTLFAYIAAHPLGALVTLSPAGELVATHIPWIVDQGRGFLRGHIARANTEHGRPDSESGEKSIPALVLFTGPDAYISPSWYVSTAEHGRVVPTWNYVAVHVSGQLRFTTDHEFLRRNLQDLVAAHESMRHPSWSIADAPADYIERQLNAIVGVELAIRRIEGKWKMSQNRPAADIDGVVDALSRSADPTDREVGEIVRSRKPNRD